MTLYGCFYAAILKAIVIHPRVFEIAECHQKQNFKHGTKNDFWFYFIFEICTFEFFEIQKFHAKQNNLKVTYRCLYAIL